MIITGIFGNVISLIVIRRKEDSSTTSKFLTSLAVADTMTLIVKGAQMVLIWGEMFWPHLYLTWNLKPFSFHVFSLLPERISKGITVAIVCDRVVVLTVPLRYKIICRQIRITAIIVMVYVVIASMTLPDLVNFSTYHITTGSKNKTIHSGQRFMNSQSKLQIMLKMFNVLVFDSMPIPVVFVCNIVIIIALRKRNILVSTTSDVQQQRKQQEKQLTKLLLTISTLFLVLAGPSAVYRFLFLVRVSPPDILRKDLLAELRLTLSLSNCAINFIVYAVMNKKYREGYVAILRRCRRSNAIEDSNSQRNRNVIVWKNTYHKILKLLLLLFRKKNKGECHIYKM